MKIGEETIESRRIHTSRDPTDENSVMQPAFRASKLVAQEYTYGEILLYRKSKQIYSRKQKIKPTICGPKRHFNNSAIFIPIKANPNPVKKNYMTKH